MSTLQPRPDEQSFRNALAWCLAVLVIAIVALVVFRLLPGLDIYVSRAALTIRPCAPGVEQVVCGDFLLQSNVLLSGLRSISLQLPNILGFGIFLYILYHLLLNPNTSGKDVEKICLVVWTVLLSTVVLINLILKEFWGRPRPYRVEELGGEHPFVLPGSISDYCESNCSFVSGEASSAAWFFAFLPFFPNRYRLPAGVFLFVYMVFFSGLRVAFGRHFLSDVVMSVLITFLVMAGLNLLFSTGYFQKLFKNIANWSNQVAFDLKVR